MKALQEGDAVRRLWRLARSAECRNIVGRGIVALALLFPILLVALDHHGFERIPGHLHAAPFDESGSFHVHSFELPHVHQAAQAAQVASSVPAVVPAVPLTAIVLGLAQTVGLPLGLPIGIGVLGRGRAIIVPSFLFDQTVFDPPVRPPAIAGQLSDHV